MFSNNNLIPDTEVVVIEEQPHARHDESQSSYLVKLFSTNLLINVMLSRLDPADFFKLRRLSKHFNHAILNFIIKCPNLILNVLGESSRKFVDTFLSHLQYCRLNFILQDELDRTNYAAYALSALITDVNAIDLDRLDQAIEFMKANQYNDRIVDSVRFVSKLIRYDRAYESLAAHVECGVSELTNQQVILSKATAKNELEWHERYDTLIIRNKLRDSFCGIYNLQLMQVLTSFSNCVFTNMRGLNFRNHVFKIMFQNVNLCNTALNSGDFTEVKFTNSNLRNVNFSNTTLKNCIFMNCDLRDANFTKTKLEKVVFRNCLFSGTKLIDTQLYKIDFENSDLSKVIFKPARERYDCCRLINSSLINGQLGVKEIQDASHSNFSHSIIQCNFGRKTVRLNLSYCMMSNIEYYNDYSDEQTCFTDAILIATNFSTCRRLDLCDFSTASFFPTHDFTIKDIITLYDEYASIYIGVDAYQHMIIPITRSLLRLVSSLENDETDPIKSQELAKEILSTALTHRFFITLDPKATSFLARTFQIVPEHIKLLKAAERKLAEKRVANQRSTTAVVSK